MKPSLVSLCILALVVCVLTPHTGNSEPLTRQQLLDMKSAGVAEKVIIDAVAANGIAFTADANAIIALHRAGFSNAVLDALTKAPNSTMQSGASPSQQSVPQSQASNALGQQCARLDNEVVSIKTACERIGRKKDFGSIDRSTTQGQFADHCMRISGCPILKRLHEMDLANECPAGTRTIDSDACTGQEYYKPSDVQRYRNIQVLQSSDSGLNCGDLKVETNDLEEDVGQLNQVIQHWTGQAQTHSQNAQTDSAIASAAPRLAPSLTVLGSSEQNQSSADGQQAGNVQQIRDNYQKRHDYLMQVYFKKGCKDVEASPPPILSTNAKAIEATEARITDLVGQINSITERCSDAVFSKHAGFDKSCHKNPSCEFDACAANACQLLKAEKELENSDLMKSVDFTRPGLLAEPNCKP